MVINILTLRIETQPKSSRWLKWGGSHAHKASTSKGQCREYSESENGK